MLIARPAKLSDLDGILALAKLAGPGFTSLAVSRDTLKARIAKSMHSFDVQDTTEGRYQLVLVDTQTGQLAGLSAVKAKVGTNAPFFNYKLLRLTQSSSILDEPFGMDILMLVNEYSGATEVGTLFVHPDYRGGGTGAGRLISQARYMLMAIAPERFSDTVISELRGQVSNNGESVFWDAVGKKFFRMDFGQADQLSAETDNEFIVDLMPRFPIYVDLLPDEARAVIGQTHPAGAGAKRYLEQEGFRYDRVIDIFDGGPSMTGQLQQLRTVKDSRVLIAKKSGSGGKLLALVSNNKINEFRSILTQVSIADGHVSLDENALSALDVTGGNAVRVWVKS